MSARIDELLQGAVEAGAVPGVIAMTATRDGAVEEHAAGTAPDTMLVIASMTKAITTVAALQLVEDGRLNLDDAVASILPEFGELQVLDGFEDDEPVLRAPASQATVRQLMCHSAGNAYTFLNTGLKRLAEATGAPDLLSGEKAVLNMPLVHDPGTAWEYGTNTDWLGQVVERVAGAGLDTVFAERIFTPLQMHEATFAPSAEQRARLMPIHLRTPDGLVPTDIGWPEQPEFWPGGHGVYSTAADYVRFLRAILGGGELDGARVLSPELVDQMFTPQLGDVALPEIIRTADPMMSNDVPSLPFAQSWGLGLHLMLEDVPGMRRAGTGDWAGLTNCYYWIDPASGVTGALFTQVLPFFDAAIIELLMGFEQAVYAEISAATAA